MACRSGCALLHYTALNSLTNSHWISTEKDTLDVWVNGQKAETTHEFGEEGTEMAFTLDGGGGDLRGVIKTVSSGNKKQGMVYLLQVNGTEIEESAS